MFNVEITFKLYPCFQLPFSLKNHAIYIINNRWDSPRDAGTWYLKRSELSGSWKMHRCYISKKYFVKNLTTVSLYQKSFISNNIVSKIKCIYWLNYIIVIGSHRKTRKYFNFNLNQSNKLLVHTLQSIHPKQNQNQITHESNKLCMLQTGRKSHQKW